MKKFIYTGLVLGLFAFALVAQAASENVTQINFTTSVQTLDAGESSANLTTQTQNSVGASEQVSETTTLNLSSSSGTGEFSSNSSNWVPVTSLTMASSSANRTFFYRDSTPGTHTLTVTAEGKDWAAATQLITVTEAPSVTIVGGDTYSTIEEALSAAGEGDTIELDTDITIGEQITIDKPVTIEGNSHTLFAPFAKTDNSNNSAIGVIGVDGSVIIQNLTIDGTGSTGSRHGVNVYVSSDVALNDVTILNNNAAALNVNGSTVTASNLNTSGNAWGAVNVDPGSGVTTPSVFTLDGGELEESTQIWSDGANVTETVTVTVNAEGYDMYSVHGSSLKLWTNHGLSDAVTIGSVIYESIQAAIDDSSVSETDIRLSTGTFDGDIAINKPLTITGEGVDSVVTGKVTITSGDVSLVGFKIDRQGVGTAISLEGAVIDNLSINNLTVTGALANSIVSPFVGMRVGSGTTVQNLTVSDSHFDGNDIGWYLAKESAASAAAMVDGVVVTDTTFNNNLMKGIYAEKLSNALFDGITVENSGTASGYNFNNGIDINLKWSDYENIEIRNSTVTGSGLPGPSSPFDPAGIAIKARDDAPSYASPAATLSGVIIDNVTVSGGVVGIRFGEQGKNNAGPLDAVVTSSSLSGTSGIALANASQATTTANANWWGSVTPNFGALVTGSVISDSWYVDSSKSVLSTETTAPDVDGNVTVTESAPNVVVASAAGEITIEAGEVAGASVVLGSLLTNGQGEIPQITVNSSVVDVVIPNTEIESDDPDWDGVLALPTVTTAPAITAESDSIATAVLAIEVGAGDTELTFDDPVKLTFAGQAGNLVGWSRAGQFTAITDECDSATDPTLGNSEDCKIAVGEDLVVWTRHFTTFVTYTLSEPEEGGGSRTGARRAEARAAAQAQAGEVLGAAVSTDGEVLDLETLARIESLKSELISAIRRLITLLEAQLAAAIAATGN